MLEEGQRLNFGCGDSEMFKSVCVSHKHLDKHVCSFSRGLGWRYSENLIVDLGIARGSDLGEEILRLFQVGLK